MVYFFATGNCGPVQIGCSPVQLPVFPFGCNRTSKHYSAVGFDLTMTISPASLWNRRLYALYTKPRNNREGSPINTRKSQYSPIPTPPLPDSDLVITLPSPCDFDSTGLSSLEPISISTPLPAPAPALPSPTPSSPTDFLPGTTPSDLPTIGHIQVNKTVYELVDILFSSTGFLGRGTVCYLACYKGVFYVIKDHWVEHSDERPILHEVRMMQLMEGVDGVPKLHDYWVVEVAPGVVDKTERYCEESFHRSMKSCRTHVRLVMQPCARPLTMFKSKKELISCIRDLIKGTFFNTFYPL